MQKFSEYQIEDLSEGQEFFITKTIDPEIIDRFSNLSGDLSPLHSSVSFAKERGFKGRVVHGFLLTAYLSELVGVYFPGINSLIQNINIQFSSPAYAGDEVKIKTTVNQISKALNTIILKFKIKRLSTQKLLARGKIQVGFTKVQ